MMRQREKTSVTCFPRKIAGSIVSLGLLVSPYLPLVPSAVFAADSQSEKRKVVGKTSIEGEASRIFRKALQCESDGDLVEAQNFYEQVIGVEPDFVFAWSNLGNVLTSRGNLDQALLCYRKAISLYPPQESLAVIILNKASIELSTGRNKDALRDLDAAEKLAGPLPPILTNKAVAMTNEGRWPEACDLFEKVISSADRDALPWWLRYSMALLESSRGKLDLSIYFILSAFILCSCIIFRSKCTSVMTSVLALSK
jgi:tetratricopeptide (TPR) repeat protein